VCVAAARCRGDGLPGGPLHASVGLGWDTHTSTHTQGADSVQLSICGAVRVAADRHECALTLQWECAAQIAQATACPPAHHVPCQTVILLLLPPRRGGGWRRAPLRRRRRRPGRGRPESESACGLPRPSTGRGRRCAGAPLRGAGRDSLRARAFQYGARRLRRAGLRPRQLHRRADLQGVCKRNAMGDGVYHLFFSTLGASLSRHSKHTTLRL
jgi:hypothetical protein